MKRLIFVAALLCSLPLQAQRGEYNFDSDWHYTFEGTSHVATLPRAFNEDYAYRVAIDQLPDDTVRYTKTFRLPRKAKGKKVFIEFEGARQSATVWINGHRVGMSENGVMAFGFDLTPYINYRGDNRLEVLTDNDWNYHEQQHPDHSPYQWNNKNFNANYGGLPKHVRLHITDRLYQTLPLYSNLGTTGVYIYAKDIDVPSRTAEIVACSEVKNESSKPREVVYEVELIDNDGHSIGTFSSPAHRIAPGATATLSASKPFGGLHFWSWGYGYLYTVKTRLIVNGKCVDEVTTRTGFRKTEFADGLFRLNDRVLMVHGYAQRTSNEWPGVGMSVPAWLSDYSNLEMVKSGGNLVRWMHVTPWKQDIESCDRVGLIQAMPAGDAEKDVEGRRWEHRTELMRDAIIYNRNNPSIIFYECGNENISDTHMAEMKATPEHTTSPNHAPLSMVHSPLYEKELLIMQQLIRHGERKINGPDEEPYTAAEFVAADLEADGITLSTPLLAQLLAELLQHIGDEGFVAERYFVGHANPQISRLAADLAEEKYQLSKYHSKTQTVVDDADRLGELIPHLLIDYKMSIVEMELKQTLDELRQPAVMNDPTRCLETMTKFKQLTELKQQMAKILGDRVIG